MKNIFKKLVFLNSFISLNLIYSQNLVNNPSFEDYSECPYSPSQLELSIGWLNPSNIGTPDYFNSCSINYNVPNSFLGFQFAKSGNAYSGIGVYHNIIENGKEYIQTKLKTSLSDNYCYYVSYYINLNNNSSYAVNKFGAYFSNDSVRTLDGDYILNYIPQINYQKTLSDTLNWVKIEGIYKANGNENYITIGVFNNDNELNIDFFESRIINEAYYYIDDVSVIPIDSLPNGLTAFAGNDTLIPPGDSIFIGQDIINLNCKWSILETGELLADSISGLYVSPLETTSYLVEQELCGLITYDTVTIFIDDAGLEQQNSTNYNIMISPNPSKGEFLVYSDENTDITIYDLQGREIFHNLEKVNDKTHKVTLNCEIGIYSIVLKSTNYTLIEKIQILK
jgi:hypothetical protein